MTLKQQIGQFAEDEAYRYLLSQGLRFVTRNYRCRMGEIDLIFLDKTCLVFTEVRYRRPSRFGNAAETVTYQKQRKLIKTALHYLQYHACTNQCRFDVVSVMPREDKTLDIIWIRDAFQVQ